MFKQSFFTFFTSNSIYSISETDLIKSLLMLGSFLFYCYKEWKNTLLVLDSQDKYSAGTLIVWKIMAKLSPELFY